MRPSLDPIAEKSPVVDAGDGEFRCSLCSIAIVAFVIYIVTALPVVASPNVAEGTLVATLLLAPTLILLTAIDAHSFRLPNVLTLPLAAAGLALCLLYQWDDLAMRALAAGCGFGALYLVDVIYRRMRGRAGLGLGDAKLLAAAGAWLGIAALPMVVLIASVAALAIVGAVAMTGQRVTSATRIPFGPFLAFGFWICWLYGPLI